MSQIGDRIRKTRQNKGMTLSQVAGQHMSAAMVSLIENGKTKPTVHTLQRIAEQLDVDTADLMGEYSRSELRKLLKDMQEQLSEDPSTINDLIKRTQEIIPNLSSNFESARLFQWYAKLLFKAYQSSRGTNPFVNFDDWVEAAVKAKDIYDYLQMDTRVISIDIFLIQVEFSKANYSQAISMIKNTLDKMAGYEETNELLKQKIVLLILQADSESGLGNLDQSMELINQSLTIAKREVIFDYFYAQLNTAVMVNYHIGRKDLAFKHLGEIEKFGELVENPALILEKLLIEAHYQEFFEQEVEKALITCRKVRQKANDITGLIKFNLKGFLDHVDDQEARCYTKLNQPEVALELFRDHLHSINLKDHPFDQSLRDLSHTYRALCYKQLGRGEEAMKEAEKAINKLKTFPHTEYYQYAREVMRDIRVEYKN